MRIKIDAAVYTHQIALTKLHFTGCEVMNHLDTDELRALTKKRQVLEQLIAFTKRIQQLGNSLDVVKEIAKPSQAASKRILPLIAHLLPRMKFLETPKLQTALQRLQPDITRELKQIMALAEINEAEFTKRLAALSLDKRKAVYDVMTQELQVFKRKTQTNLAIRVSLHERGVTTEAPKLAVSQENISAKTAELKTKENVCKQRIKTTIKTMIEDTQKILSMPSCPDELKAKIQQVQNTLEEKLEHLHAGKDISDLPVFVESLEIDSGSDDIASQAMVNAQENTAREALASADIIEVAEEKIEKGLNYFQRLRLWLNTPWEVSWSALKQDQPSSKRSQKRR